MTYTLEDFLCIIHRDGGHYIEKHGLKKATEDALEIHYKQRDFYNENNLCADNPQPHQLNTSGVSGSTLPDGWMDWNALPLDQMVEHLRKKYMFSSSADAKCIYHLIEFYDKHK